MFASRFYAARFFNARYYNATGAAGGGAGLTYQDHPFLSTIAQMMGKQPR